MTGFALVHGGHGGAWSWEAVVPLLDAPAVAIDLPARGGRLADSKRVSFRTCAEAVLGAIEAAGLREVIAVGYSLGGLTISALADLAPHRVAHLIYLAALVPPAGTTVFDLYFRERGADPPRFPTGIVPLGDFHSVKDQLLGDVPDDVARRIHARMVAEPVSLFEDPAVEPPASIPRTYVRCAHDVPVPPPMATAFIERLGPSTRVIDLDVGHGLVFTHPENVATILNDTLRTVRARHPGVSSVGVRRRPPGLESDAGESRNRDLRDEAPKKS